MHWYALNNNNSSVYMYINELVDILRSFYGLMN